MNDIHVLTSGGGTSLTAVSTIGLGGDGAVTAGVPIGLGAQLAAFGGMTTIADTIKELQFFDPDLIDNANGWDDTTGGAASGLIHNWINLPYNGGTRSFKMAQNTGGANNMVYTMDIYPGPQGKVQGPSPWNGGTITNPLGNSTTDLFQYGTVFGGALTALTWATVALAPTNPMPAGRYAILGAKISSLTNYGVLRFLHNDFGSYSPGFPVVDPNVAIARANTPLDPLFTYATGRQFTYMSQLLGGPLEPIFSVTSQAGIGLRYQMISITGDTPQVTAYFRKVG